MEKAGAKVEVTARAIRQIPAVKPLVEMCGKAVAWQRLLYRMKLLSVTGEEVRRICQPLRRAFLQKMGLPPGTAAKAVTTAVMTVGVRHVIRHITSHRHNVI